MSEGCSIMYSFCFAVVVLLVQGTVHVKGSYCIVGREDINVEGIASSEGGQYVDLQHPLTCSGSIVTWHFCFYTADIQFNANYRVYLRVYRNESTDQLKQIHQVTVNTRINPSSIRQLSFICTSEFLDEADFLHVLEGDYLAAYIPSISEPLRVVGTQVLGSEVYLDTRNFPQPFDSDAVQFSELEGLENTFIHLNADVVSPDEPVVTTILSPQPTTSRINLMPTSTPQPTVTNEDVDMEDIGMEESDMEIIANTTDTAGDSSDNSSAVMGTAVTAGVLLLFAVFILLLILGVVLYKRRKMESVKKALLQINPPHLAIDNATYDLPMLGQHYRLFKSSRKDRSREPSERLSRISVNVYETHYDEGIAEVFGLYATLRPSSVEFRSSVKKVVTTLSKTKPTPYQLPATHEEQIYKQISGQQVPSISSEDIQTVGQLGSGQFANVEKAVWSRHHGIIEVAVKTLHSDASPTDKLKFLQEGAITSQFRHPNVIFLYGIITDKSKVSLVMEHVSKGDLKGCLANIKTNPGAVQDISLSQQLLSYSIQVALGMLYLSDKGFVHRDLAARNILVSDEDVCKIADFGMSRDLADAEYYIAEGGTIPIRWTAPEAVYYRKYSSASDMWSYGCVLYEIWSLGHRPFEGCSNTQVLREISIGFRLPPPPGCPYRTYEIMIKCWHPSHVKRPSFEDALRSLLDNEEMVLEIPSNDAATHENATCLGADLQAGHMMYSQLQSLYIPNSASISDRPSSIALVIPHTTQGVNNYETLDKHDDPPSYLNVNFNSQSSTSSSADEDDSEQMYKNIETWAKARVKEVIYDDVEFKSEETGKEHYYNVVSADKIEEEIYTDRDSVLQTEHSSIHPSNNSDRRNRVPPLAPKPITSNSNQASATNSLPLIDSDYYEAGESTCTFTVNNDQVVV